MKPSYRILRVLDLNTLFEKKNYKISLETKLMSKVVRNTTVHDSNNWTCNNSNYKIGRKKTGVKIKDSNVVVQDNDN